MSLFPPQETSEQRERRRRREVAMARGLRAQMQPGAIPPAELERMVQEQDSYLLANYGHLAGK